ncbi:hypothetical protein [Actinoplanes awajinensis]|uniref:Uncharacterized protein n=1 Tax=Actinoplanes awajinensis subsp. mycoplanecinus TaxID=135947 RepID=A0A101JLW0_9ACTN|nr:hypothetical protein [Actinoplanes awajinensis]KUL29191.1 hypothetical protein ADL15_28950 [Actinoplanes awajinensis subsp. mycoplanecinus]
MTDEAKPPADEPAATDDTPQTAETRHRADAEPKADESDESAEKGKNPAEKPDDAEQKDEEKPEQPEESKVEPDELRMAEALLKRILGPHFDSQTFARITATGASMYGNGNVQVNASERKRPNLTPPAVPPDIKNFYVPVGVEEELGRHLDHRTTVCLTGGSGTGRLSTAYHALAERFGDAIVEIQVPQDESVAAAVHEKVDLRLRHGYLLSIGDEDPAPIISRLDAEIHRAESKLVLIRNRTDRAKPYSDGNVDHVIPNSGNVFRAHAQRLAENADQRAKCLRVLETDISLPATPGEVVALVERLLPLPGPDVVDFARTNSHAALLKRAASYLEVQQESGPPGRRRLRQHRRAFRIAYAAAAGRPIGQVFTITGLLLSQLDAESGWTDLGRTALEHSTAALLGDWHPERWGSRPLARLDDDLLDAVFDVAWHEFDHTRPALVAWLNELVAIDEFRPTAIHAATKLAMADFDEAFPQIVDAWSRDRKLRVRQAAAQTAMALSLTRTHRDRALQAVHDWVSAATKASRDTAAAAYASGLRQNDPQWDLADLRTIAGDPAQWRSWTIAEAVRQLLEPALAGVIVRTLADWIRADGPDRMVIRHAARALVRMADVPVGSGWDSPPMLLAGLRDGTVPVHDLGPLWHAALLADSTRTMAWPALLGWLQYADAVRELRGAAGDLLTELTTKSPPLRRRLRLLLDRPDAPGWIAGLIKEWTT